MSRTFATYIVSGAGMTNINGRYVPSGNNEFTLENGKFKIWNNNFYWFIKSNEDFTNPYKTTDNPATPDLGTWVRQNTGIDPPPTVVAGTPIPANPDILVSGAGSDLVNGTYEHTAFEDGKPIYTKGSEQYRIESSGLWLIRAPYTHPEYGNVEAPYYQEKEGESGSPATPDLVAEWEIWTMEGAPTTGVNPPPNVTAEGEAPDPTHDIAVDPLTATAGITEPTLTQTHKLSATALSASGNITEPTLRQTQSLTVDSLEAEANLSSVTLTQTHALGTVELVASARLSDIELTQTHTLDINSLTANAGLTEPTLTQTHIINVDPLGMVANLTDIDFAQTHVIDIEPLWAQIELSDLTLAQHIRTSTPECRRLTIHAEDRTLTIHAEDRTLTIPREDRTLRIKCCE